MAISKCPECGKEVSTSAETCPHCGYPIKKAHKKSLKKAEAGSHNINWIALLLVSIGLLITGIALIIVHFLKNSNFLFWIGLPVAIFGLIGTIYYWFELRHYK